MITLPASFIGETAVVEDDVSYYAISHALAAPAKESGDRAPKNPARRVLIGPGAKILGNIEIGEGAQIGASSVVLKSVRTTPSGWLGFPAIDLGEANAH